MPIGYSYHMPERHNQIITMNKHTNLREEIMGYTEPVSDKLFLATVILLLLAVLINSFN